MQQNAGSFNEQSCAWCSSIAPVWHYGQICPRIKAIEYFENGGIKRIEFKDVN